MTPAGASTAPRDAPGGTSRTEPALIPWSTAVEQALGTSTSSATEVTAACGTVIDRLRSAKNTLPKADQDENVLSLLDAYDAAIDLLSRWAQATTLVADHGAAGQFRADILLHDFRPVRPYAIRLGEMIMLHERTLATAA